MRQDRPSRPLEISLSSGQLIEQRLRLLQIRRVEAFSEPAVDRSEQFSSLPRLPLITPEPRHAHGGAEFPGFRLLLTRNCERTFEMSFSLRGVWLRRPERYFACNTMNIGLSPLSPVLSMTSFASLTDRKASSGWSRSA